MASTRARQPRRRRTNHGAAVPLSMVRATAYSPVPALPTPPGALSIAIRTAEPMMPVGVSLIQVIFKAGGGQLADPIWVALVDPTTIQVVCSNTLLVVGVYIPFNDPGFRGINGGMLNPGELAVTTNPPRAFPWVCALG